MIKPHSKCVRSDIFIPGRALKPETPAIGSAREAEAAPAAGRNVHQVALQGRGGPFAHFGSWSSALRYNALVWGSGGRLVGTLPTK